MSVLQERRRIRDCKASDVKSVFNINSMICIYHFKENKYVLTKVRDGFLKLNLQNGECHEAFAC